MRGRAAVRVGPGGCFLAANMIGHIQIAKPPHLGPGEWQLSGLRQLSVLFGKNGSGKSLLLRGWRNQQQDNAHYIVPERIGTLDIAPGLLADLRTPRGRMSRSNANFAPDYRQQVITRIDAFFSTRGFHDDRIDRVSKQEIEHLVNLALADFTFTFTGQAPPYNLIRSANEASVGGIDELSSGEAQAFALGLDVVLTGAEWLLNDTQEPVLLIDEPDAHLHPDLQARLADVIVSSSRQFGIQVVVATHSTTMLSALGHYGGDQTAVIYLDRVAERQNGVPFDQAKRSLSASLGGVPLIGALFDVPLLLVEGDDDFRVWSQVPRHHQINLSVIPCDGSTIFEVQLMLEKIFASVMDKRQKPMGYALIDGDIPLPQPTPANPQKYVRFVQLDCREVENLYVTDEVLHVLGSDWETARAAVAHQAASFGEKTQLLQGIPGTDRKLDDVKAVIQQLEQILDPKRVLWSIRVGKCLGEQRPQGQLADFLGEAVINALWGPLDGAE